MHTPTQEQINVLLVDNESRFRTGLAKALKACPYVSAVGQAGDSREAVDEALRIKPKVILTDIVTPRSELQQMIGSLKEALPNTRLIILTNSEKDEDVLEALSSGVDGYLLKVSGRGEIIQAVLKSAAGESVFSPAVANRLVSEFGRSMGTPKLSEREAQVLKLLGEGLSNSEISERLCVSGSTVRTYVCRIMEKLNLNNRNEVVAYGARHYLTFTKIAEGFKTIRTRSEPGHGQMSTAESAIVDQRAIGRSLSARESIAPENELKETVGDRLCVKSERRQVTAVFACIEPLSGVSGNLNLEQTDEFIDQCLEFVREEIGRYNGIVGWFRGHGVMSFFGIHESHEYGPQLALYAALAIRARLCNYIEQMKSSGIKSDIRIGVNSGVINIEKNKDGSIADYKPAGNTAELAIGICDIANAGSILVTQRTYRLTEGFFEFKPWGEAKLKGEEKPIEVYMLLKPALAETKFKVASARGLTEFVGRESEISLLRNCFDKVKQGRSQVVGILGEAGVGKSRLLLEFNNKLSDQTYTYLEGSCLFYGDSNAYLPFLRALRAHFDIKEDENAASINKKIKDGIVHIEESMSGILSPLQDLMSSYVEDETYEKLKPVEKRGKIFEAIRHFLIHLSQVKPLVLAIEDLHWIDKTSEELITYLINGCVRSKIMLMLIYRPEYDHVWNKKSYYTQINLDELSNKSATALVRSILHNVSMSADLCDFILEKCGGNPLFLEEFVRYQLESGLIIRKNHKYMLSSIKLATLVPETTQGIIAARIDRLDDKLKYVLQVASVIGDEFGLRVINMVGGIEKGLDYILQSLQGLELIHITNLLPQPEYAFKHAIIRDTVYNGIDLRSRKEIHQKIGEALEQLHENKLDEAYEMLAYHYSKSNNLEKAYLYLRLSGDKAKNNYSNWEALSLYKEALSFLHKLPDSEENRRKDIATRYEISASMTVLGYPENDSLQILKDGEKLCRELGDERRVAEFCSLVGSYYALKGHYKEGKRYIEKAYKSAVQLQDLNLMVAIGFDLCRAYVGDHYKTVKFTSTLVQAVEQMQKSGVSTAVNPPRYYSYILMHYGSSTGYLGDFERGQNICEEGLRLAQLSGDKGEICYGECLYGWLLGIKGDMVNAIQHLQNAIASCEELQFLALSGFSWAGTARAYYLKGELETARECAEKALQVQREMEVTFFLSSTYNILSMIYLDLRDPKKARLYVEEALRLSQNSDDKVTEGISKIYLGRILVVESPLKHVEAERSILEGIDILETLKLKVFATYGYFYLGKVYADTSQGEKAVETLKKAESAFREMGADYWVLKTREVLDRIEK
jgi:DNA-binding NarL/FixJ family response regulator/class 3 adenylate cyclase/tetratricopeptide (TPR) repeat protein/ABC-type dipeptide/oligopeptide/nickel transport system ATPase component